jgi:hypothetical protein
MNASVTAARIRDMSPRVKARLAGGFYLVTLVAGALAQGLIADRLIVPRDAALTATNILAHETLFRLGFAIYLIEMSCQITMTVLMYDLLKPVSKSVSLLAATFGLVGCVIKTLARLFFIAPVIVLGAGGAHYLSAFNGNQLQALALLFLRVNYHAETIAMVFFGLYAIVKGYLVMSSTFLPRVLGVLSVLGGLGWLTYLYEPFASRVVSYILIASIGGALTNIVWLLVFSVDEKRWKEQARTSAASVWR